MEHERQLSESLFQPLNNFRNRFCQPCFCYVTHAQSCHRFKIINGENVQYLIFLKQKILASSIDTFHCPCPPHITPPVVNGPSVTMKIFFFFTLCIFCRWQHYITWNNYHCLWHLRGVRLLSLDCIVFVHTYSFLVTTLQLST